MRGPLEILYRDAGLVAVHKPSGLLVHPTKLASGARESCLALLRDQLGSRVYPVHRLDRSASGVLLFGLSPESAGEAAKAFREKRVEKVYYAVVRGWLPAPVVIDKPLRKKDGGELLPAVTEVRELARAELDVANARHPTSRYSLVEARTRTGRLHQIRRHLVSIRHPIVGDTVYGDGRQNRIFRESFGSRRLLLMAQELNLPRPDGKILTIRAAWPPEIRSLFQGLGWESREPEFL